MKEKITKQKSKQLICLEKANIFYLKNKFILKDVNLSIDKGDFIAVFGPNGSGKTTLIKSIIGITKYNGKIKLEGKDIKKYSRREVAKKIAYIAQVEHELEGVRVIDYLLMSRIPHKSVFSITSKEDIMKIDKMLKSFGIANLKNKFMDELSGGQKQIISIMCGILQETNILFIDEPTNHLDPKVVLKVFEILKTLNKQGKTIVLISHSLNKSLDLANKVILIKDNHIFKSGFKKDVIKKSNIDDLFEINSSIKDLKICGMEL